MHLESGRFAKLRNFFQNRGKNFWVPVIALAVAGLGFGAYSAVKAITEAGDGTRISIGDNARGYTYDNNAIYYGVNEGISWKPWSTRWYVVKANGQNNDAMCLQASRVSPSGSGTAQLNTTDVKRIMLATVPSYSAASAAAGGPNYYNLFKAQYDWKSKASSITNLMTRDTNINYGASDERAVLNGSGEEIVKYTDYYYGCPNYYNSCSKTLDDSKVKLTDAIFAIGHMIASGIYSDDYYALSSSDKSVLRGIKSDIDTWFNANYPDAVDAFESYATWADSISQTIGWLEYKGVPVTRVRFYKASTTGAPLANATFTIGSTSYTTGSDGYTSWIDVEPGAISYRETNAPTGYAGYTETQTCTAVQGSDITCTAQANQKIAQAAIKIKKVFSANSSAAYAGLSVSGTQFSVKNNSGAEVTTITIGADGTGTSAQLSEGTYTITEKSTPSGVVLNSGISIKVIIGAGDDGRTLDMTGSSTTCANGNIYNSESSGCLFKNDVVKGKVSFSKTGYELGANNQPSSRNLAGISFTAVNKSDSSITYTIGPTSADGSVTSPEMIYGNYIATEVRGTTNAAYDLMSFDFSVTDSSTASLGTKNDTIPDHPSLSTTARNSDSSANPQKELEISPSAGVTDHITCSGLVAGASYRLVGEIYNGANEQVKLSPTNNTPVTATVDFVADASGGCTTIPSSDMVFPTFDTSSYINKTLSIKQYLYKNNGTANDWVRIFIHNPNLADTNEQVKVKNIEIATTANSERSINNKELAAGKVKILDTYEIIGLTNGQIFNLEGSVKDSSGNVIATTTDTIQMTLTTGAAYRDIMTFEFDSTPYVGQTLYVHQVLKNASGSTLVTHTGTADNGESVTVLVPTLITDAASAIDNSKELYVGTVDVKDKVTYTGLAAGSTYIIKGELWKLKADGSKDVKIADATDSFTASSEDDTTTGRTLTFTDIDVINKCAVNNKLTLPCKFVVFEYIYYGSNSTPFSKHEDVADSQQIVSVKTPTISTVASESQNGSKKLAIGSVSLLDKITYNNLVPGQTYIVKGKLVDAATGATIKDKSGNDMTAIESFPATANSAEITVDSFNKFDSTLDYDYALGENQKKYVVFQTLYYGDIELTTHEDLNDADQTLQIGVPTLHTDARYKTKYGDTSSKLLGVGDVTMIDYVDYEGLVEGEWYMIEGYIFDPETGDVVKINDEYVENSKTFKAGEKGRGTVTLEINLNTLSLQGRKFVVHERLYRSPRDGQNDSRLLAEHKEALDEGDQTIAVKVAKIETTATDKLDGDNVLAHEDDQTIHDNVVYDGLLMGEKYTLYGYLWDKTNNQALLDTDGKRIEAYASFATEIDKDNGTIEMDFPVDAYDLPGVEIVVYEYLFQGEKDSILKDEDGYPDISKIIVKHADPDSASQTVKVSMRVGTAAADVYDGDQEIGVGKAQIIDHLKYEGAKMGQRYKAKGWLVLKDTGESIDVDGETIFTVGDEGYEETTGFVPITFELDSRELIGKTIVVYEELYLIHSDNTEELVAEHKDLNDSDQTINIATPTIHTTATDGADGDKELLYDADVVILDKIDYTGLVKGTTYTLRGQLVDKSTGNRASGGTTEVTLTFTPTRDSGSEEIEFPINTTGLAGKEFVVFETLYIAPEETPIAPDDDEEEETDEDEGDEPAPEIDWGFQIAEHKDLNDEGQTVRVKLSHPDTGLFTHGIEGVAQTGLVIIIASGLIVGTGIYVASLKRQKTHGTISFE